MKRRLRTLILAVILVMGIFGEDLAAFATNVPYDTYNYDYWDDMVATPAAYVPDKSYSGSYFTYNGESIGNFLTPQDIFVAEDGIYIADTGNKRVIKISPDMKTVLEIFDKFEYNGESYKFDSPYGLAVSDSNRLYVADKIQKRIWVFDEDRNVELMIENPKSEILDDDFDFAPLKVAVDYANRIYVVAAGKTQGILVFDSEGNFTSFFGTIPVKITPWERFWRRISTQTQLSKQALFIPTEFTGIDVDPDGFVYSTNYDTDGSKAVMKLNPKGEDVIRKGQRGSIAGDVNINGKSDYSGASTLVDIVYRGRGIYSVVDSKRGRVFTYDSEGNILYIFGGLGSQEGTFAVPTAIEELGDKLVVLDQSRAQLVVFAPTEYGRLINEAVGLRYDGDEAQAVELWKEVLKLDENFELANDGIGKAYLTAGDNEQAMKYLKLAMDKKYYSVAFRRYRNEWLKKNLGVILTVIIISIIALVVLSKVWKFKKKKKVKGGYGL